MIQSLYPRIANELSGVISEKELHSLGARRAVTRALNNLQNGKAISFRNDDPPELREKVQRHVEWLREADPSKHILFRGIEDRSLINIMLEEALHWGIESPKPLNPDAARAILEIFKAIDNLPVNVHKILFPLMMSGYLLGHSTRVAIYTVLLAESANMTGRYNINLAVAAIAGSLHDLGKNREDLKRLCRIQGKFSQQQYQEIQIHPELGVQAIDSLNKSGCSPIPPEMQKEVRNAALTHHVRPQDPERSYPKGISYDQVGIAARIVSIADAFDAMTTRDHMLEPGERIRRVERAYEQLSDHKGFQFDPDLVEIFLQMGVRPAKGLRPKNNDGNLQ